MKYEEAFAYIHQLNSKGITLGLDRITVLLEKLGNPQEKLKCVHVAGTNGKGSVCTFIASALQMAGLRVGRYISPTLYGYLERFQINGEWMPEDDFAILIKKVQQVCERMAEENLEQPTAFEVETAVAFLYFEQQNCDYVVLETGMGGRQDSTNVIKKPVVSVVTRIGLDHTAMLGNTLTEIAAEKSGIIKPGCPVVIGPQKAEALEVLMQRCESCAVTPVISYERARKWEAWSSIGEQKFSYKRWKSILIKSAADYQCENAMIALDVLDIIRKAEPALTREVVREGMAEAYWSGRFEILQEHPMIVVDGAHNPDGARALAHVLERHYQERKIIFLMSVFQDKAYTEMAQILSACSDTIYCFCPKQERGLDAGILAEAVKPYYRYVFTADSAEQALKQALKRGADSAIPDEFVEERRKILLERQGFCMICKECMIVCFGSLSTVKEVQEATAKIAKERGSAWTMQSRI